MKIHTNLIGQFAVVLFLSNGVGDLAAQAGHRIDRSTNQVVINQAKQWENWVFAPGTIGISPSGEVQPNRIQKNTNATLDIVDFLRFRPPEYLSKKDPEKIVLLDAIQGGSNRAGVVDALDGNLNTYWEPGSISSETNLASQWWFTVDLGRVVFINKIVLKFAAEGDGDPFLLFDVLVSDGQKPVQAVGGASIEFFPVLQTLKPNKSQRTFEIDLDPVGLDQRRGVARFIQIVVQSSDFDRGEEVSKAEYEQLPTENQGLIEYRKRQFDGREIAVKEEVYHALESERQGAVLYFRRERPRLAELEIWTNGDDLVNGVLRRNGSITSTVPGSTNPAATIDGDVNSVEKMNLFSLENRLEDELFVDLGSFFWFNSQRMGFKDRTFGNYRLEFSDGSLEVDGALKWITVVQREQTKRSVAGALSVDGNDFELVKGRFFRLVYEVEQVNLPNTGAIRLSEMQLFGQGFLPRVILESDLIRLGGSRNLVAIEWDAVTPPGTRVELQSRTGDTLSEILHYYKKDGSEVTKQAYEKMLSIFRGDIIAEEVAGIDWEPWSVPYQDPSGSEITSPSPREFLKLRATLHSEDPELAAKLSEIRLYFAEPVAQRLLGEVVPNQLYQLGQTESFSLFILPEFTSTDRGFNELLLKMPPGMTLEFTNLFGGEANGEFSVLNTEIVGAGTDSLHLAFEQIAPQGAAAILRLDFEGLLFSRGGLLEVALRQGENGAGIWQRVDSGEAIETVTSNRLLVVGQPEHRSLFTDLVIEPSVLTPNGDGINDAAKIRFSVVLVEGSQKVVVTIYDLQGRSVQQLAEQRTTAAGPYSMGWDGMNRAGKRVPPGLYIMHLHIETNTAGADLKETEMIRTLAVAY